MSVVVQAPPREVQLSTLFWVTAVAAGGVETVLGAGDAALNDTMSNAVIAANVAFRVLVYAGVLAVASRLWQGRNWARWTLAVVLGGIGMLTLVAGPIGWLAGDHAFSELDPDGTFAGFAIVRAVHVVAVVAAVVLMFRPTANAYFRAVGRARRRTGIAAAAPRRT